LIQGDSYSYESYPVCELTRIIRTVGNPFSEFPPVNLRTPKYDLRMFAENYKVKSIGKCVFNSMWIGRCFGKDALKQLKTEVYTHALIY
jgi:hypothetical protein